MTKFDDVAVRVTNVQPFTFALGAEKTRRTTDDVESARRRETREIGGFDNKTDVVNVLFTSLARQQVDDRRVVDPDRGERHRASAPLVDPHTLEPQLTAVPGQRAFDVGDGEDEVVEPSGPHG